MSKDTSGQAFPGLENVEGLNTTYEAHHAGLSKREYFAAKAMQSILAYADWSDPDCTAASMSRDSYKMADEMIAESAK